MATVDHTAENYYKRLDKLRYEFNKVGVNYNQTVKAIHTRYDEDSILNNLERLIVLTKEIKEISLAIVLLTDEFRKKWLE